MSNYDPFQLYARRYKSTHKGQVLRKKIPNYVGYCFTNEQLDRAIEGLVARGYHVFKPGVRYGNIPISFSQLYIIDPGSITFSSSNDIFTEVFSSLWEVVYNDFTPYLQIDPLTVKNLTFRIDIISINLFGKFSLENASQAGSTQFQFYFFDPNSAINIMPDAASLQLSTNNTSLVSIQSISDSLVLGAYRFQPYTTIAANANLFAKQENTDQPYLNTIIRQQPAVLTALKNKDYDVFNPDLFSVVFSGTEPGPATFESSMYTVKVHLQYEIQ